MAPSPSWKAIFQVQVSRTAHQQRRQARPAALGDSAQAELGHPHSSGFARRGLPRQRCVICRQRGSRSMALSPNGSSPTAAPDCLSLSCLRSGGEQLRRDGIKHYQKRGMTGFALTALSDRRNFNGLDRCLQSHAVYNHFGVAATGFWKWLMFPHPSTNSVKSCNGCWR